MERPKATVDAYTVMSHTDQAKYFAEETVEHALKFLADPDKKKRLEEEVECKTCFYIRVGRIGGAACTSRPCGVCEEEMYFGSTNTDTLCKPCGRKWNLCSYCGGDLHMRVRRKDPVPNA